MMLEGEGWRNCAGRARLPARPGGASRLPSRLPPSGCTSRQAATAAGRARGEGDSPPGPQPSPPPLTRPGAGRALLPLERLDDLRSNEAGPARDRIPRPLPRTLWM